MKIRLVRDLETIAGQLAQGLRHQARLQADVRLAHLALDLGLGHQGRHRVDDDDVHRVGADQHLGDLQGLLAVVGLGDQQVVDVDAELAGVLGVERVLGVDEGGDAAASSAPGAMTWRASVVLPDDSGPKISTTRPRGIPPMPSAASTASEPVGMTATARLGPLAQAHDRPLAELPLDLRQRRLDGAPLFVGFDAGHVLTFLDPREKFARDSARL